MWTRRGCGLLVAAVAAYASYRHQRDFAVRGGADAMSAALWPLSVDGLLMLATVGLLRNRPTASHRRWALWAAFLLGIGVSLAANIAAAPALSWNSVLVAGWPPVSLLLAVELLVHAPREGHASPQGVVSGAGTRLGNPPDPLLTRAREADARHRRAHQRPISAETLRKELRVGSRTARQLVAGIRADERQLARSDD